MPLHEVFANSEELKGMIQTRSRTTDIQRAAMNEGMTTLMQDGIRKVLTGVTTFKQVRAVAMK